MQVNNTYEKVSFNLPSELKQDVLKLKETLNVSLNSIYKTAIAEYIEKQEIKKWQNAAILASKDEKYLELIEELNDIEDDIYEY